MGVVDCTKKVIRSEGFAGFYRGCGTNLLRTTPSAVITFTSFEMIHRFLERVLPPNEKFSQARPKSQKVGAGEDGDDTIAHQSQNQSDNVRTPSIPLGSKEKLTARH